MKYQLAIIKVKDSVSKVLWNEKSIVFICSLAKMLTGASYMHMDRLGQNFTILKQTKERKKM